MLADTTRETAERFEMRVDKVTQTSGAAADSWLLLMQRLPADPPAEVLLSHVALSTTIVRLFDMRLAEAAAAADAADVIGNDAVFDALAAFFSRQFAGDGADVFMPELQDVDGPVARVLMSCRCASGTVAVD